MTNINEMTAIDWMLSEGYETIEEWAADSDYEYFEGDWYQREDRPTWHGGSPVDLEAALEGAYESWLVDHDNPHGIRRGSRVEIDTPDQQGRISFLVTEVKHVAKNSTWVIAEDGSEWYIGHLDPTVVVEHT